MKFGDQLRSSIIKEYQWHYIAYDELKAQLMSHDIEKSHRKQTKKIRKSWTEEDETKFLACLESELDKVHTKQKVKAIEIGRRIAASEVEVKEVTARLNVDQDAPTEAEFMMLEEDLSDIIADVHDLAKFVQLNYTGFQKIIKKHDVGIRLNDLLTGSQHVKLIVMGAETNQMGTQADIFKLSKLYDVVRTRGNPVKGDSAAGGGQGNFIRQTTKYWVHPDNITEVKLIILKHLPVLVFNANKEFESKDSAITSIYYDNPETWELYKGRLKKTEGAEAIRMRWYSGLETETIFVERKTHREDWTGEKSVKSRFSLKEKNMNAYLRGDLLPEQIFEKARREGKKPLKQIDDEERLAKEIQYSILHQRYKPVCRSFYNRTAFQLPADARVRISLDTELTMVREDNLDGRKRSGNNWRRMDIGIDYPFSHLPAEDVERFPYAVLEVKLQTQAGQEAPGWVRELIASHLVEAVPKFSKFIHGVATLFPTRINLLPYWMPQMDIDIRKPVIQRFGIRRPGHSYLSSTSDEDDSDEDYSYSDTTHLITSSEDRAFNTRRASSNDPDMEEFSGSQPLVSNDYPIYDSDYEEADSEEDQSVNGWSQYLKFGQIYARLARQKVVKIFRAVRESIPACRNTTLSTEHRSLMVVDTRYRAPKGKKIHVPTRVEPKVYFAAERTYLSWLEYCVYLGYISVTVLNFGPKRQLSDLLPAFGFVLAALISTVYAMAVYSYRSNAIRKRKLIRYHDRYGPTLLCVVLLAAILLNFWQEISVRNGGISPGALLFGADIGNSSVE